MKKYILLILATIIFAACSNKPKAYVIGVSQCVGGKWRDKVNNEMLSAQHLYDRDVKVIIRNADNHSDLQALQIDSLVDMGIDLLVVAPNESDELKAPIENAIKKGVPVVFFDRKIESVKYSAYIGGDNVDAGYASGKYVLQLADKKHAGNPVHVLELSGPANMSPALERHEGFSSAVKDHNNIIYKEVKTDWTPEDCYNKLKKMLQDGEKIDVVFCHSDLDAFGTYKAAKELHKENEIDILGVDGLPGEGEGLEGVQKGILAATYIYPTHGEEIIQMALKVLEGKKYDKNNSMQSFVVTPANVNDIIVASNVMNQQNEHLVTIQNKLENYLGLYNIQRNVIFINAVAIFLLLLALFFIWKAIKAIKRSNRKYREMSQKMKQLNEEQTLFYTNASHQLKTPLTLITGPLKVLSDKSTLKGEDKELLNVLNRNVAKLDSLVSDVINFRKEVDAAIADENAQMASAEVVNKRDDVKEGHTDLLLKSDSDELPTVLIVDDNDDMRKYLRTLLASNYYVIEASDGESGLRLARESVPNLIVSDVMMPVMDGLQLCKAIKEDSITSHIPVILLTARSTEAQQIEGFEHGADAYVTKPFNAQVLITRINNLLQSRSKLRKLFSEKVDKKEVLSTDEPAVQMSTPDSRFMEALKEAVDKHIEDAHLKMDDLGEELGMSRVQLYRKVKALTGLSPVELLRKIRLQKAYSLLLNTDMSISEIAYEVGFGTPSYFSSCFKKQYDKYPTDVRK